MRSDHTYEVHKALQGAQSRHQERDIEHRRALRADASTEGVLTRMTGSLRRLRPAALRPPIAIQDVLILTDRACRLPDGGLGQVAVRESEGELIEVCVPA